MGGLIRSPDASKGAAGIALRAALLAVAWFAVGWLTRRYGALHPSLTPLWPPAGIGIAALLLGGRRLWPGVLVGAAALRLSAGIPPALALSDGLLATLEAMLGAWLLREEQFHLALDRTRDVLRLTFLGAGLAALLPGAVTVLYLALVHGSGAAVVTTAFFSSWLGDALGALVVLPLVLAWTQPTRLAWTRPRRVEAGLLLAGLCAVAFAVFLQREPHVPHGPLAFATFPFVVWAAARLDLRAATLALAATSAFAVAGTAAGLGALGVSGFTERIWLLETFLLVTAFTTLLVAAAVAEREGAAARLREAERALAQAMKFESLGLLAGGVAHDFKNLLTGIQLNLELARDRGQDEARLARHLDGVEKAAQRANELCKTLLAFAGKERVAQRPVELGPVVEELVQLLLPSMGKTARLELELAPGLPAVSGDPSQLRQLALNLIVNAREALRPEGGLVRVRTGLREVTKEELGRALLGGGLAPGPYVFLSVEDDGVGMSEELQARVFEPFFTTKKTGHGLGLALVHGVLRAHAAALEVASEEGKGARFTLLLRAAPKDSAA